MKVIRSKSIFIKTQDSELIDYLRRHTTFQLPVKIIRGKPTPPVYITQMRPFNDNIYELERNHIELLESYGLDLEIIDKSVKVPAQIPKPLFTLRDDQQEVYDSVEDTGDIFIQGNAGFGKTITALALAHKFQQKTLVVCTNVGIANMWVAEIKKWFGITAGKIMEGRVSNLESPIVVSNIQTLTRRHREYCRSFGVIIIDEAHHTSASTFLDVVANSYASIRIALSATPKRADGMHCIFKGMFGSRQWRIPKENNVLSPTIIQVDTDFELGSGELWANNLTELYDNDEYKALAVILSDLLVRCGHKVLMTSDRLSLLDFAINNSTSKTVRISSVEGTDEREELLKKVYSGEVEILASSISIMKEGISVNPLSALVLTGSTNNESLLEQVIGRIQRTYDGKHNPVVVDICLSCPLGTKHARERRKFYSTKGWKVLKAKSLEDLAEKIKQLL